jgi:hypothetical protein
MSSKRQQREERRQGRGVAPRRSLLRRTRDAGGVRFGVPIVVLLAVVFALWLIFDLGGVRL